MTGHNHICVTCRYYMPDAKLRAQDLKSSAGHCHCHPPVTTFAPVNVKGGQAIAAQTSFPVVSDTTWCGDHSELSKEIRFKNAMEMITNNLPELRKVIQQSVV